MHLSLICFFGISFIYYFHFVFLLLLMPLHFPLLNIHGIYIYCHCYYHHLILEMKFKWCHHITFPFFIVFRVWFIIISAWIICSVNSILKLILKIIRNHSRLIIFIILDFVCFSHFYFYFYQNIQAVDKTMKYMIVSTWNFQE